MLQRPDRRARRTRAALRCAWLFSAALSAGVTADCTIDDFDDRDASGWAACGTHSEHATPVWDADSGRYCLGVAGAVTRPPPPPLNINAAWLPSGDDPYYSNGCLRTTLRTGTTAAGTWATHFAVAMRTDCKDHGYYALLGPSLGRISLYKTGALLADRFDQAFAEDREYVVEMCVVDAAISLKYWDASRAEPPAPQLKTIDGSYRQGHLGIAVFMENANQGRFLHGCFDDVRFSPAPACHADLDCSGGIALPDLRALLSAWGAYTPCPPFRVEDLDRDCRAGFTDLLAILHAWGPCG